MKYLYILILSLLPFFISACTEEPIGQTATDNQAPQTIKNVVVESMPGGAKISYDLPKETDISYVRGEYVANGKKHIVRSSIYHNYVMVEGLGTTEPFEISIYTVDHSENASEPIKEMITPGTPPVKLILASMKMNTDFGGVNITWDNELGTEVGITILATNEKGELEEGETLYTEIKEGEYSFRGYDTAKRTFAITLADKWGNLSDTIKKEITPYFEKLLDKKSHKRLKLPADNQSTYGSWSFEKMFDGITTGENGWHTNDGNNGKLPLYFTVDVGVNAKLSRLKLWHRSGQYYYSHYNIKSFELWGSINPPKEGMLEAYWTGDWKNDWQHLGDFVTLKPSGMDGPVTNADKDYAALGFEFLIPLEAQNVRYLRFVMKNNWTGGSDLHLTELSFYGNDKLTD